MQSERDVLTLIAGDTWMMNVLEAVRQQHLPDGWIGAGFVRRKVWDTLHGFKEPTPLNDIDVLFFDPNDLSEAREKSIECLLAKAMPGLPWSVKNQARMHVYNGDQQYVSTINAMHYWLETPTCAAVRLGDNDELHLIAPYGIKDLLQMIIRPTPAGVRRALAYRVRINKKNWSRTWPKCQVFMSTQ